MMVKGLSWLPVPAQLFPVWVALAKWLQQPEMSILPSTRARGQLLFPRAPRTEVSGRAPSPSVEVTGGDPCGEYRADPLRRGGEGVSHCILAPGKRPGGSLSPCGLGHCRPLRKGTDVSLLAAGPVSLRAQVPAVAPLSTEIKWQTQRRSRPTSAALRGLPGAVPPAEGSRPADLPTMGCLVELSREGDGHTAQQRGARAQAL